MEIDIHAEDTHHGDYVDRKRDESYGMQGPEIPLGFVLARWICYYVSNDNWFLIPIC